MSNVLPTQPSSGCSSSGQSTGLRSLESQAATAGVAPRRGSPPAGSVGPGGYIRLGRNRQKYGPKLRCSSPGCFNTRECRGLCGGHYQQLTDSGSLKPLYHKRALRAAVPHPTILGAALLPLTRGYVAIIDAKMADLVSPFRWAALKNASGGIYAQTRWEFDDRTAISLHRFLWERWGLPGTPEIDHENGNGIDCRRENLRAATRLQNVRNSKRNKRNESGFKGVNHRSDNGKFRARIRLDGVLVTLGQFDTGEEAHAAYAAAAREHFGEFARLA